MYVSNHIRSDAKGLVLKRFFTMLLVSLTFYGCDKDPISGLEKGWIWDTIGLEEEDKSTDGELRFDVSGYDGNFKIYEGISTLGQSIIDRDVSDGDIFTEILPKGEYTIKWSKSYSWGGSEVESESFTHGSCTTVRLWYDLLIYERCF